MNYIEEVLSDIKTLESAHVPNESYLRIQSEEDISPEALLKAKSITFSQDYEGPDLNSVLPGIIYGAPNLKTLLLHMDDCSVDLSSLNLKKIERLSIHADNNNSFIAADMPQLFDLSIHFDPKLDAPCMVDLSRAPFIKSLSLLDTNGLDFSCLKGLKSLEKLHVRSRDITDLDWLNNMKSNLISLTVEGKIIDCEGVISQPALENLCLCHHVMLDVTPIEKLPHLKSLNLLYGTLLSEGSLREKGIKSLRLSSRDEDYRAIRRKVRDLCFTTARAISFENRVGQGLETSGNVYLNKVIMRRIEKPIEFRIEERIASEFEREIKNIECDKHFHARTMDRLEYISAFKEIAISEYPFLQHKQ